MSDNLSDLEQLLEDLGRPKSMAPSKKTRSSVVNLNELEALMSDLADPPPPTTSSYKSAPPARSNVVSTSYDRAPVAAKPAQPRSAVVSTSFEADDLDSIMNALNGSSAPGSTLSLNMGGGDHNEHGGHEHHDFHDNHFNDNHFNDDLDNDHAYHDDHHGFHDNHDDHHQHQHEHHDDNHHHHDHNHHHDHGHHGNGHEFGDEFDLDLHVEVPPPVVHHAPAQPPPPKSPALSRDTTNTIDELEDLLNGLDDTSSRASVRASISAKPPVANPRLSVAPRAPAPTAQPTLGSGSSTFGVNPRASVNAPYQAPAAHHAPSHTPAGSFSANVHAGNSNSGSSFGLHAGGGAGGQHAFGGAHAGGGGAARPSPNYNQTVNKPFVANSQPKPPNNNNALDALLGDLQSQLHSVPDPSAPSANGLCAACGRVVLGEVITALGNRYHPEHFVCGNCQNPLGTSNFYEQDGVAHCERCYQELLCPRCGHCDEPILDRCVTAMGKKWHLDHFVCTQCLNPFKNGSFFEREGRAFCDGCFATAFAPRCGGCNQPVSGPCITACGQSWHPEHFVCNYCHKAFTGSFYEFGGKPYCELHYHQQTGSLCGGCGKAISGRCVDALGKKWHPEHFVCAFCMNMLAAGSFTENTGKAYCKDCHGKLFG